MKPIIIKSQSGATTTEYTFFTDSFSVDSSAEYTHVSLVFRNSMGREEVVVQYDYLPSHIVDYDVIFSNRYQSDLRKEIIECVQDYVEEYILSDKVILDAHALIMFVATNAYKFYLAFVSNYTKEQPHEATTQISTPFNEDSYPKA